MTTPSDPNQPGGFGDQPGYGQQPGGYQPSGLPSFPAAPPPSEAPQQTYEPPTEIQAAFWCFIAAAVVIVVGGLLSLGSKQQIIDTLRANNTSNLTADEINSVASVTLTALLVVAIIIAGLFVLFAFKVRAGRNWARITLAIVAVLDLISLLNSRGSASILSYIGVIAAVVGAILAFTPKASEYMAAVKRARRGGS
jgi:hypothetical protein